MDALKCPWDVRWQKCKNVFIGTPSERAQIWKQPSPKCNKECENIFWKVKYLTLPCHLISISHHVPSELILLVLLPSIMPMKRVWKAQKLFLTPFKASGIMICGMQSLGHLEFGRNFVQKSQCSWQDFFHWYTWPSCSALRKYGLDGSAEGWVCMAGNPHSVLLQMIS